MLKVLRNGLLRYILYTCPNLWCNSCSKCYGMDCFGTYFTHVQTCDVTRVQSATEWTDSVPSLHMSKPVMYLVFKVLRNGLLRYILYTCPNLWCNSCSKCYGMDCFGTYFTHVQTCDVSRVHSTCSQARLDKKRDENAADTTAKRKMPQKMNPIFRAQEIWTCYNSMQITMF